MDINNNSVLVELLKQKQKSSEKKLMVRIPFHDETCLDFEYVPIEELISKLEKGALNITIDDIQAYVETDEEFINS